MSNVKYKWLVYNAEKNAKDPRECASGGQSCYLSPTESERTERRAPERVGSTPGIPLSSFATREAIPVFNYFVYWHLIYEPFNLEVLI